MSVHQLAFSGEIVVVPPGTVTTTVPVLTGPTTADRAGPAIILA